MKSVSRHIESKPASHSQAPFFAPIVQPKPTVNPPGDEYEKEADAVADQVMRMPASIPSAGKRQMLQQMPISSSIQRKCTECEKEEKEGVQRKETGGVDAGGKSAPPIVNDVLSSSGGQPIDGGTRQFMESRFGQDFSQVRIHTDSRAAESATAIQARAYTSGRDVVFGAGEYRPESESGKRLLAHELSHVIQQGDSSVIKRKSAVSYREKEYSTINSVVNLLEKTEGNSFPIQKEKGITYKKGKKIEADAYDIKQEDSSDVIENCELVNYVKIKYKTKATKKRKEVEQETWIRKSSIAENGELTADTFKHTSSDSKNKSIKICPNQSVKVTGVQSSGKGLFLQVNFTDLTGKTQTGWIRNNQVAGGFANEIIDEVPAPDKKEYFVSTDPAHKTVVANGAPLSAQDAKKYATTKKNDKIPNSVKTVSVSEISSDKKFARVTYSESEPAGVWIASSGLKSKKIQTGQSYTINEKKRPILVREELQDYTSKAKKEFDLGQFVIVADSAQEGSNTYLLIQSAQKKETKLPGSGTNETVWEGEGDKYWINAVYVADGFIKKEYLTSKTASWKGKSRVPTYTGQEDLHEVVGSGGSIEYMTRTLSEAFQKMVGDAESVPIAINSGFRTYEDQVRMKKTKGKFAAAPGTSPHQSGIAVDINNATYCDGNRTEVILIKEVEDFLVENAHKYSFFRIDKRCGESHHWEYRPGSKLTQADNVFQPVEPCASEEVPMGELSAKKRVETCESLKKEND